MDSFDAADDHQCDRRSFVSSLAAATGGLTLAGITEATTVETAGSSALESLSFYSPAAQVSADGGPLTDRSHVVAWASADASVTITGDDTDEADVVFYEDERIPLISQDGPVMGIGSAGFLSDDRGGFQADNEEFVLNVWDELLGPDSLVLWDESHRQYWDLESHDLFRRYAEDNGYDVRALEEFETGDEEGTLEFYSTASQLAADGTPLTESQVAAADDLEVVAWAEPTATNGDQTGSDAIAYPDDEAIPLITRDGGVVGFGAPFVEDDSDHDPNRAFTLGVWDDVVDGETVYWDESHDQYYDTSRFETFVADAERAGYTVEATDDLLAVLEGAGDTTESETSDAESGDGPTDATADTDADAIVITTPADPFTDAELAALEAFVADGGSVFLHDQSDYGGHAETANLNEIAARLDLGFRFNADQVEDETSGWDSHVFTTTAFDATYPDDDSRSIGLADADGLVITTPEWSFRDDELEALEAFVDDGGALFLFDQSDFGDNDRTENLNEIAAHLDLAFRFNDGQVEDPEQNAGPEYEPVATDFSAAFDYLANRNGVDISFDRDGEYYGRVVRVFDGDTFEIEFDTEYGYREVVRNVGIDTPETPPTEPDPEEWVGIPDDADDHLHEWGENAAEFALERLAPEDAAVDETDIEGRRVKLTFDEAEPIRGNYGRLLGYLHYDPDDFEADPETGSFTTAYNREIVDAGHARVYSSGFSAHDAFTALEEDAIATGRGVWEASDLDALSEIRNDPVDDLFIPSARSVYSARGWYGRRPRDDRVVVSAASSAEQQLADDRMGVTYDDDDVPLVAVDDRRRVALVGGLPIHEDYEADEEFGVDTSDYGNFPFLTNLLDSLSDTDGDVVVAGGQGQFNAAGSISLEDCMYYQRYLEGVGIRCRQINDFATTLPAEDEPPRAVLLSAPARRLDTAELVALHRYRAAGGAVVLLGSADAPSEHIRYLNAVADWLHTDLRFNADAIVDPERNVGADPSVLETTAFDESSPLFDAYDPSAADPERGEPDAGRGDSGRWPGTSGDSDWPGRGRRRRGHRGSSSDHRGPKSGHRGSGSDHHDSGYPF